MVHRRFALPLFSAALVLVAAPEGAAACSADPILIDDIRSIEGEDDCLLFGEGFGNDDDFPSLVIRNECAEPIEVHVEDCTPCDEFVDGCIDCDGPWHEIRGGGFIEVRLGFFIDENLGQTVETSIDWTRGDETGSTILELALTEQPPSDQVNDACSGLCSVSEREHHAPLGGLLLLIGLVARGRHRPAETCSRT